jgi:hypothetical protein
MSSKVSVKLSDQQRVGGFVRYLERNEQARETVRAMLDLDKMRESLKGWRGDFVLPPGTSADVILSAFKRYTDIPLEIPFFAFLHFLSGMLLQRRVKIKGLGAMNADLWTVVLADSGSGKTWAHDAIAKASPVKSEFPMPASGAAFIESLQSHNFGLWFVDEIAQTLKQIEQTGSPLADVKTYLLNTYGSHKIERTTKKNGTITIDEPCLSILGMNTPESFYKSLSQESLLDGFAQRFAFVVAETDPLRPMQNFPLYEQDKVVAQCGKAFDMVAAVPVLDEYIISTDAKKAYEQAFEDLLRLTTNTPASFFRRAMFRTFRYALLYHIILGKTGAELDPADIAWGARLVRLHLADIHHILNRGEMAAVGSLVSKIEQLKAKRTAQGLKTTPRDVQQRIRGFESVADAAALLKIVEEKDSKPAGKGEP